MAGINWQVLVWLHHRHMNSQKQTFGLLLRNKQTNEVCQAETDIRTTRDRHVDCYLETNKQTNEVCQAETDIRTTRDRQNVCYLLSLARMKKTYYSARFCHANSLYEVYQYILNISFNTLQKNYNVYSRRVNVKLK